MSSFNILTRRAFLNRSFKVGLATALSTLVDIPWVMRRALAEGNIGLNGKKLLFIFLRGGEDGLNSVIPIEDSAYNATNRSSILIPRDAGTDYSELGGCDFPVSGAADTYSFPNAIRLGNGFAALHPSLKFLAPVYNAGDLAIIHRVGYPKQSRSHFSSQDIYETGSPNNPAIKDGIFYRTLVESGLAGSAPITGVSIQPTLPLLLRGSEAAMTNLTDPTRYDLLGIPNTAAGNAKGDNAIKAASLFPYPDKANRNLLDLQYQNLGNTLSVFSDIAFDEGNGTTTGNYFRDDVNTDGDTAPYYLFPTTDAKNGGYAFNGNNTGKFVVDNASTSYTYFKNLKAAALILNKTDAIIAGTELTGFDHHSNQGGVTGSHSNLLRRLGWTLYALRKYFTLHADKVDWNNVVVVTMTEFGRTTVQNNDAGTDHAEAGAMTVSGGAVKGYNKGNPSGVFGCHPSDSLPWVTGQTGTMFGVNNRYLKRSCDYRSVLGEVIRKHLGATSNQINRIIPGYANPGEVLLSGGTSTVDGTPIRGEVGIL